LLGISPIPKIGAVAGNVKVGNRSLWLNALASARVHSPARTWEKRALASVELTCITVVPGALGACVRSLEAGGRHHQSTGGQDLAETPI